MIQINNLTKIYKSKKKNNHKALDDINLTLPNNGLVFVIGKSGSGKSTLLNLLGGLDNITIGNIVVDGNDITKFKESDLADYRNNHIGFIFQDYHLLEELTVYENIVLSLNLNKIKDDNKVSEALSKVGLSGYENRYPQELSGGERQRVAIARAIVKKPYVILADEPTGNLDNETGSQIVDLLKELSKECLILIVSHNTIDTYKYADRIIKLSNGKIISDENRNPEYLDNVTYIDNVLYYPMDKTLTEEDIRVINKKEFNKIVGKNDKYLKTSVIVNTERNININKNSLSLKDIFKLCLTFLKSKVFRIIASSFMIAIIIVILSLSQTIINFNSNEIIFNEMNKIDYNSIYVEKKLTDIQKATELPFSDCVVEVEEGDFEAFSAVSSSDVMYEVLSLTTPVSACDNYAGQKITVFKHGLYIDESLGTMIVDENFFIEKLGKLEYVALSETPELAGLYITDYLADAILMYNTKLKGKSYEDILGEYYFSSFTTQRGYINGIIKTDYAEKYKEVIKENMTTSINDLDLYENREAMDFLNSIFDVLGYSYTFNKNFREDFFAKSNFDVAYHHKVVIDGNEAGLRVPKCVYRDSLSNSPGVLVGNEVIMEYQRYNDLYGTNYNPSNLNTFVPHTANVTQYRYYDTLRENPLSSFEINIVALSSSMSGYMYVSEEIFDKFNAHCLYVKGYYFKNNDNIGEIINLSEELNFEQKILIVDAIHTMTKAVDVFIPIFELVAIVLCSGVVFILISFATKMIKDKMHDIGILKALGCKNYTIGIVFGLQLLLIAICTILLSTIGYFLFIDLANDVLIESLKVLAPSHIVLDLDFLTFKMDVVGFNVVLVIVLTIISFVIPMLKIYKIKPVQIIKTKE